MSDYRVVLTTTGSHEEAKKIANTLVQIKLAACVNIVPSVESVYRFQGKVESSAEFLLIIKTTADAFERVRDAIKNLHSYDLPECIALKISDGSTECLDWIKAEVE
jgi:periplasmic divalent cation tolerance protein